MIPSHLDSHRRSLRACAGFPALLLALFVWFTACTTTRTITHGVMLPGSGEALVMLHSGARLAAVDVSTRADSVIIADLHGMRQIVLPSEQVDCIVPTGQNASAFQRGVAFGTLAGALVGAGVGWKAGKKHPDQALESRGEGLLILGTFGLFAGGPIGGIVGLIAGPRVTYRFDFPSSPTRSGRAPCQR